MSNEEYKDRIRNACAKAAESALKEYQPPSRKNNAPEKEVEKECLALMRSWGWSVEIYESKATYDPKRDIYRQQAMKSGTADCMGSTDEGISAIVEFKAPKKLTTLSDIQREFLVEKIGSNCFAIVTDSAERLQKIYRHWQFLRRSGNFHALKEYLLSELPKKRERPEDRELFGP